MAGLGLLRLATVLLMSVLGSAATRAAGLQDAVMLCDESVVASTCQVFNSITQTDVEAERETSGTIVSALTLSDFFFVQVGTVSTFLKTYLGLDSVSAPVGFETETVAPIAVMCADLCASIISKIPDPDKADTSDTACFVHPTKHTSVCDVNVSVKGLQDIHFDSNTNLPNLERMSLKEVVQDSNGMSKVTAKARKGFGTMTNMQLLIATANAFHIFPLASTLGFHSFIKSKQKNDGDEGCKKKDCTLSAHCYARFKLCNMCEMCGGTKQGGTDFVWNLDKELQALRTGAIAQAFVAQAIRAMNLAHGRKLVQAWFGSSKLEVRKELMRILLGLNNVLANVKYIKVSQGCRNNRFAFVEPERPGDLSRKSDKFKNKYGQYLVFLCNLFYDSSVGVQLETLLHEGSHHWPMAREDMCTNGNENDFATKQKQCNGMAYGRQASLKLTDTSWKKAIKNADNIAYFVNDVYKYTSLHAE